MKDEDSDIGCALVSTDQCIPERLYNSSGAGANAILRLRNMTLRRSDPLSELVWSSDKGVCVKSTDISILADKNQLLLRNVGLSNQCLSTSQSVGSEGSRDKIIADEENLTKFQMVLHVGNKYDDTSHGLVDESNDRMEEEAGTREPNLDQECSTTDKENEDVQNTDIAKTSKEDAGHVDSNEALICPSPHLTISQELSNEDVNNDETKFQVVEEEARKLNLAHLSQEKYLSLKRSFSFQEKGKQKEVSIEKSSNDSHESVESCNGTSLFLKGTKRQICDQEQISGSKRMKNQIQGSYCTVSPSGHDSSFMSWISNMVKGPSDSNKDEPSSLAPALTHSYNAHGNNNHETSEKTRDSGNLSSGFQNMFHSLYGQNTKKTEVYIEDTEELMGAEKMSRTSLPRCHNEKVNVSPSNTLFNPVNASVTDTSPAIPHSTSKTAKISSPLPSLWITRLYTQATNIEEDDGIACQKVKPSSVTTPQKFIDGQNFRLCNFISMQSRVLPAEMVHAVRKLRLTRSDILRWMISDVSMSHLNGFFVRLRLGTVEAGRQYYVACILGDSREHNDCKSKKSLWVDIGGTKSSVATRFISNSDFLEDEIDVWWSRLVRSGGNIPSLDMLNSKYKEKKALGDLLNSKYKEKKALGY